MIKIGLDGGHGLGTKGKQTPDGIKEWELNDKVCDKITEYLSQYKDVEVIRTDNDEGAIDENLDARIYRYVKDGVNVFVSIHHNALSGTWGNATGVEVYTDRNATAKDIELATLIHGKLAEYTGLKGRGVKKANFAVINQNKIPAVLVEGGFMDSRKDYPVITSEKGQDDYARAVAESLVEFLGLEKKERFVELETVNDIVWELGHRGIITDGSLWMNKLLEDVNAYWLARKCLNYIREAEYEKMD